MVFVTSQQIQHQRSVRSVPQVSDDKLIEDEEVERKLLNLFYAFLHETKGTHGCTSTEHLSGCPEVCGKNQQIMQSLLGYTMSKAPSTVLGGGTGVKVKRGFVPRGSVVALYPGCIYRPFEPIFFQSLGNPFIFRCIDKILIDGNDKAVSKFLYLSCAQRDRIGPIFTCDASWLTNNPINPLAVGQYVNNQNKENPANVCYQEFDFPDNFPFGLRKYIPNINYTADGETHRLVRTVALVAVRDIEEGEELFSTYFTLVH